MVKNSIQFGYTHKKNKCAFGSSVGFEDWKDVSRVSFVRNTCLEALGYLHLLVRCNVYMIIRDLPKSYNMTLI